VAVLGAGAIGSSVGAELTRDRSNFDRLKERILAASDVEKV
jgi:ketopantoate reductase